MQAVGTEDLGRLLDLDAILAEKARRRLREFARQGWHVVEPATPFHDNWHIGAICEHLEAVTLGQIRNLLITMPPRHMKSLLVAVFWPCWEWTTSPFVRWLFSSYAQSLSIRDSVKCRRLIESDWYQRHWGDRFELTSDQNQKMRFENDKTGYRIATSVGGAATGEGGDRVVCDDPHNVQEASSDTVRQGVLAWWDEVMSSRLNDAKLGAKVIVQQRVHQRDLAGHVLSKGGYEHLNLPTEYEPTVHVTCLGWKDPRTKPGALLWPERFGVDEVAAAKRDLGSYAYSGQHQQHPSPAGGGRFKRHWWRYWHWSDDPKPAVAVQLADGSWEHVASAALPWEFDEQIQSWDMAFKDHADADFVVGQCWGRRGANKFLLDQVRSQMGFSETKRAFRAFTERWPKATAKLIEDKANGPAIIDELKSEISGIIPVEPDGGKVARAEAATPDVEAGNVFLPHPSIAPWVNDFIEEHAAFPKGANDDQVDAETQAIRRLRAVENEPKPSITDKGVAGMWGT